MSMIKFSCLKAVSLLEHKSLIILVFVYITTINIGRGQNDNYQQFVNEQQSNYEQFVSNRTAEANEFIKMNNIDFESYVNSHQKQYKNYITSLYTMVKELPENKKTEPILAAENELNDEQEISKVITPLLKLEPKKVQEIEAEKPPAKNIKQNTKSETIVASKTSETSLNNYPNLFPSPKIELPITSPFGVRNHPIIHKKLLHKGVDIACPLGTQVLAAADGVIIRVQKIKRGYGNNIIIHHENGYTTLYAHLSTIEVEKGEKIKKGEVIGKSGNTGLSTGPHLHFEVRFNEVPLDPKLFVL
ncbi:MAG: M23 family metallopeptidase [Salinivirgaceae bacterium]|nr:M23 family metallopeptidase [Salinivirgaceae bacterium]